MSISHSNENQSNRFLERVTLKDQVKNELKSDILTGVYDTNDTYTAGSIAKELGVSLTPVREALIELQSEGLVEILPQIGFRVIKPSMQELLDVLELREVVETYAISKIAGTLSLEAQHELEHLLNLTREFAEKQDLARYLEADRKFHVYLVSLTNNNQMAQLVDKLRLTQRMPALRRLVKTGNLIERALEHAEIVKAITIGDVEKSSQLIRNHIALTRKELIGP